MKICFLLLLDYSLFVISWVYRLQSLTDILCWYWCYNLLMILKYFHKFVLKQKQKPRWNQFNIFLYFKRLDIFRIKAIPHFFEVWRFLFKLNFLFDQLPKTNFWITHFSINLKRLVRRNHSRKAGVFKLIIMLGHKVNKNKKFLFLVSGHLIQIS